MFDSREDALEFRDQLVHELDATETDGFHVSARLDAAHVRLGTGVARVRGHLDSAGYTVTDATTSETEDDGWTGKLEVKPHE